MKIFFNVTIAALLLSFSLFQVFASEPVSDFSPEELFNLMENSTQNISAMKATVELSNKAGSKEVVLSVKNPDKFSIVFADGTIQAYFNGQNLWIYLKAINEVFYHYSDQSDYMASYFSFFSPKKIFTNLTRKSLFALFNITSEGIIKDSSDHKLYCLKFVPKMRAVFKKIFAVGHYKMIFSDKNYLPVEVVEFGPDGLERGRLKVLGYEINEKISDESFNFVAPENAVLVPIKVVIAQKIEEYARSVVESLEKAAESIKKSLLDWSF